jgi:hypothetical protein
MKNTAHRMENDEYIFDEVEKNWVCVKKFVFQTLQSTGN